MTSTHDCERHDHLEKSLMKQTDFITAFVKMQDKKSLLEQPNCVFIRLDILQVYR